MGLGSDMLKRCHSPTFIFVVKGNGAPNHKRAFECLGEIVVFEVIRRKSQILTKKMF